MTLGQFFQFGPVPADAHQGHYILSLVLLSYFIAVLGSYVALDMAEKLRSTEKSVGLKSLFLIGGAISMGLGIWTMHFIGMEAFDMGMPMYYDSFRTMISLIFAVLGSGLAFYLIKDRDVSVRGYIIGGITIATAIVMMHYTGMSAMLNMTIRYRPFLFAMSIVIALASSIGALWLMITGKKIYMKILSALIMGLAITLMHYTGMLAAVIIPAESHQYFDVSPAVIGPYTLSLIIGFMVSGIIFTAYICSRLLNKELIEAARKAGVAEVAVGVLHNAGNVLNSVNISAENVSNRSKQLNFDGLKKASELLTEKKESFNHMFPDDERMKMIPQYIKEYVQHLEEENHYIIYELESLTSKINHLKHVIHMQQIHSRTVAMIEYFDINELMNEVLLLYKNKIAKEKIAIIRDFADLPLIQIDKTKIMQILVNMIKNAIESIIEKNPAKKTLILQTSNYDQDNIKIEVIDNGVGFDANNLTKMFSYGFTTKKNGHGFGLHTSAVTAQQEGGNLSAFSQGPNQGATFTLILPKVAPGVTNEVTYE